MIRELVLRSAWGSPASRPESALFQQHPSCKDFRRCGSGTDPSRLAHRVYIEREIGSIRRECLDHVVVFGTAYLRRSLAASCAYYSGIRTHLSLGKGAPISRLVQSVGRVAAILVLGGLHHHYVRMALTISSRPRSN